MFLTDSWTNHYGSQVAVKNSAKTVLSATLVSHNTSYLPTANSSLSNILFWALSKNFAECQGDPQQKKVGARRADGQITVTTALPSAWRRDTWQRLNLCRVSLGRHSANIKPLSSALVKTLSKDLIFAECNDQDTQQKSRHMAKIYPEHWKGSFAECRTWQNVIFFYFYCLVTYMVPHSNAVHIS